MAFKYLTGINLSSELQANGSTGTSGQVLTSGGAGAPPSWADVASGGVTASNYVATGILAANQSISVASTDTLVSFVDYADPQGWWNPTTKRFNPKIAGYYSITFQVLWSALSSTNQTNAQIRKNGNSETIQQRSPDANIPYFMSATKVIYLNGSTDYVEFTVWSPVTTQSLQQGNASGSGTNFSAALILGYSAITTNPMFITRKTATQVIAASTSTIVNFSSSGATDLNRGGFTMASGRVTVPTTGIYKIKGTAYWDAAVTTGNNKVVYIYINGSAATRMNAYGGLTYDFVSETSIEYISLTAGDIVDLRVYQTSPSNVNLLSGGGLNNHQYGTSLFIEFRGN